MSSTPISAILLRRNLTSSTHSPDGCPPDEPCLRSRATPQLPMKCAISATHPPYSCPHDETRLNASTAQFPARWNPLPRARHIVAHAAARFAVLASRLPVATSSSRRTHPAVACAMRSPSINSPHGCPHNELICDYTHLTISRAMSFIRCSHLAVARAMSSPPDTSHLAAFLRDELVFRHPVSRSYPRAPVVFSDKHLQRSPAQLSPLRNGHRSGFPNR